jgi:hypothetical protein
MNELIGLTIKTHDNAYLGKVKAVEPIRIGVRAKIKNGLDPWENDYVALAVEIEEKPSQWSTLIAKDGFGIHKRYVM